VRGRRLLLEEELRTVRPELEKAHAPQPPADDRDRPEDRDGRAVRTGAFLHPAGNLALADNGVTGDSHHKGHHDDGLHKNDE
jgi:hypothetical protein